MLFIVIVLSLFFNCQRKKAFLQCVSEQFRIASRKTLHEPRRTEHSDCWNRAKRCPENWRGGGGGNWEWGFSPLAIIFFRSMTSRSTLRSALSERLKEVKQDISCKVRRARWGEGNVPFASLGSESACHVGYNYSEWLSRKWPHMPACVTSPCTGTVSTNIGGRHKPRNKKFERATVLVIHSLILLSSGASLMKVKVFGTRKGPIAWAAKNNQEPDLIYRSLLSPIGNLWYIFKYKIHTRLRGSGE